MAGRRIEEMSDDQKERERVRKREAARKRRQEEKAVREAQRALTGAPPPRPGRKPSAPPTAAPATPHETAAATPPTQVPSLTLTPISPRVFIRAGQLAGRLEAVFNSGGTFRIAAEDDARTWLRDTPMAASVVSELLSVAGYAEDYELWAAAPFL